MAVATAWACLQVGGCIGSHKGGLSETGPDSPDARPSRRAATPRVYSIGERAVLTFKRGFGLAIPVYGSELGNPSIGWAANITGTSPIQEDDFELIGVGAISDGNNVKATPQLQIRLTDAYMNRVRTGDHLLIRMEAYDTQSQERIRLLSDLRTQTKDIRASLDSILKSITKAEYQHKDGKSDAENIMGSMLRIVGILESLRGIQGPRGGLWAQESIAAPQNRQQSSATGEPNQPPPSDPSKQETPEPNQAPEPSQEPEQKKVLRREESKPSPLQTGATEAPNRSQLSELQHLDSEIRTTLQHLGQRASLPAEQMRTLVIHLNIIASKLEGMIVGELTSAQAIRPLLSSVTRTFLLYEEDDYRRDFLTSRLQSHEIAAFPLPSDQVRKVFGNLVDDHFYVVALSITNHSDADRLVNTGMITAYGSALVAPGGKETDKGASNFTVPVEVSPSSKEQVYTLVADEEPARARAIVFRTLEFVGALSTSIAVGFDASEDLVKAIGVYTGVGMPEGRKLWPDRAPGFLRNIVAYGMPELIKVPKRGSVANKVLFFSKGKLSLIISDARMFHIKDGKLKPPHQEVAHLSFDTLEVPFETVVGPEDSTLEDALLDAKDQLEDVHAQIQSIRDTWVTGGKALLDTLEPTELTELGRVIDEMKKSTSDDQVKGVLGGLSSAIENVGHIAVRENVVDNARFGLNALGRLMREIDAAMSSIARGRTPRLYASTLKDVQERLDEAGQVIDFYAGLAKALHEMQMEKLRNLQKPEDDTAKKLLQTLQEWLASIEQSGKKLPIKFDMPGVSTDGP